MCGEEFHMFYKKFSIRMGPIDVEYTRTDAYSQLYINLPVYLCTNQVWTQTFWGCILTYAAPQRISALGRPAFRYLHALLSRLLTGRGDNARVINLRELYFLWSMVGWELIHISHTLACQRHHQVQYPRLNYFFRSIYHTFGTRIGLDRPMH